VRDPFLPDLEGVSGDMRRLSDGDFTGVLWLLCNLSTGVFCMFCDVFTGVL
jgi:hypothetical protein